MALNIFPRREARQEPTSPPPAPEPPIAVAEEPTEEKPRRRSTRSRRTTSSEPRAASRTKKEDIETETEAGEAPVSPAKRRTAAEDSTEDEKAPRRRSRSRARKDENEQPPEPEKEAPAPRERTTARQTAPSRVGDAELKPLLSAIEAQGKQLEALAQALKDGFRRVESAPAAPPPRVGVFVDVANVELASDRTRQRLNWGKVLDLLCRDRQLIRAIAYAPVHDDPQVSRETQRFVEPFLDKGYKIVTKPLKRFSDGSVKANVDVEIVLDVVNMLDRLDVVCLVSGDGDFEPLVRWSQARGVRVEVVSFAQACAQNLRNISDDFIDLGIRHSEVKA